MTFYEKLEKHHLNIYVVLDGTDDVDGFKTLRKLHNSKKGNFYLINCMELYNVYEHFYNQIIKINAIRL